MTKHMEELLDLPIRALLDGMQWRIMGASTYFGIPTLKCPLDQWIYQEIIFQTKPDLVVELGVYRGGSTLALAHLFDAMGQGNVLGIDTDLSRVPQSVSHHPRINLLQKSACAAIDDAKKYALERDARRIMVIEDSDHSYANTLAVMQAFGPMVTPGCYMIVEDGICNHGLAVGPKPGPYEAIEEFLKSHNEFVCDREREAFLVTWNPKGFLRRQS